MIACSQAAFLLLFGRPTRTPVDYKMSAKRRGGGKAAAGKGQRFELTDEQKLEIREAFDLFDTDGSGTLQCTPNTEASSLICPWRRLSGPCDGGTQFL